jgi:exopolysaccharide biosynthesis polyprenyl glycosylphosphotransferase
MSLHADPTAPNELAKPAPRLRLVEAPAEEHHYASPAASGTTSAQWYRAGVRITDAVTVALPIVVACISQLAVAGLAVWGAAASLPYWQATGSAIAVWYLALWLTRARDPRILGTGRAEYGRVAIAGTTTFAVLAIAHILLGAELERWLFVFAIPAGVAGLLLGRALWRQWLRVQVARGRPLARVVVVGPRADVDYVLGQLEACPVPAYRVVGAVVDGAQADEKLGTSIPVSGDFDDIPQFVGQVEADAVIVAGTPGTRDAFLRNLAWHLERSETGLMVVSTPANVGDRRLCLRGIGGLSLVDVQIARYSGAKHVLKRAIDILGSGLALIVLMPLLLVIALVIRLDSPGPVIFPQERIGRDGRPFRMLKFRSMHYAASDQLDGLLDRNDGAGLLFKMRSDPRVTRVGKVIRRHSLDELPQLWNVFVGAMSLVGPRPPLPSEVQRYDDDVHRRLNLRPGLTGVWQISGRSMLSWDRSVELDLYYVENWTVLGDILIIVRTVRQLTNPVGAF